MTPDQFQFVQQQFHDVLITERWIGIIAATVAAFFAVIPASVIAYFEMAKRWERIKVEVAFKYEFDATRPINDPDVRLNSTHILVQNNSEFPVMLADVGYNRGRDEFFPETNFRTYLYSGSIASMTATLHSVT